MAVVGIGVDAIEIDRVELALARTPALVDRLFTATEREHCLRQAGRRRAARFAGRFAAKEAVAKALGTGVVGFGFRDIEIVSDGDGAPRVALADPASAVAARVGVARVHVSLSLTSTVAVASAVAES